MKFNSKPFKRKKFSLTVVFLAGVFIGVTMLNYYHSSASNYHSIASSNAPKYIY